MKFKDIKQAKKAYLDGHKISRKALLQGDSKTNNNIVRNQMNPAFEYIKNKGELKILIELLEQNENIDLKQAIAVALLPHYEDIAINALEHISNMDISNSFTASMVLKQWKKGAY